jgi:hypothetical protein
MRLSRRLNQFIVLVAIGCLLSAVGAILLKSTSTLSQTWAATLSLAVAAIVVAGLLLRVIRRSSYFPTPEEVQQVTREIRLARDRGIESHKAQLHFVFPPHWKTQKAGKEGWVLRPLGLGMPVSISVWVTDQEPGFADTSFDGMTRNVRDLARQQGAVFQQDSIRTRDIAGVSGLEYVMVDASHHETLGFFWTYQGGDFQVLVDASGSEHLRIIRPAVDAFLQCCHMR